MFNKLNLKNRKQNKRHFLKLILMRAKGLIYKQKKAHNGKPHQELIKNDFQYRNL